MKHLNLNNINVLHYTPVLTRVHEEKENFNKALKKQILQLRALNSGISNSNRGGWHSELDLLQHLAADTKAELLAIIGDGIKEMLFSLEKEIQQEPFDLIITAWANVSESGNYNALHTHPGSVWSGVYYIEDGDDPESRIVFPDLRIAAQMIKSPLNPFDEETLELAPIPGLIVVFPSWLPHAVKPYQGEKQRISIAFNVSTA